MYILQHALCGSGRDIHIYKDHYEHEAILKPKTENNRGAPSSSEVKLLASAVVMHYAYVFTDL